MNLQEVFDKVYLHAMQMERPSREFRSCRYRTRDGNKCFVGALIKDEFYEYAMEGVNSNGILVQKGLKSSGVSVSEKFLHDLQRIHDSKEVIGMTGYALRDNFKNKLFAFAMTNDLKIPEVN